MLLSHPAFQLFSATLYDVVQQGIMQKVFLPNIKKDERFRVVKNVDVNSVPVGLRWTMHPELGFPRKPFTVWRRVANYSSMNVVRVIEGSSSPVNVFSPFYFGQEMYLVAITCTVPAGQSILLTPLGRDDVRMLSKQYRITSSGTILFKAPFITGILCEGMGAVTQLAGIPMNAVLYANDWEQIQVVGFPFKNGEVGGLGYQGDPQGFVGSLTTGVQAAEMRLRMGEWLFMPPPGINAADAQCQDVDWRHPDARDYLQMLNGEQLKYINECLSNSDDFSFIREQRQISYVIRQTINGITQPGSSLTPKPTEIAIPVVKHTLLSITNESPASLGLGFGTYDFVPIRMTEPQPRATNLMMGDNVSKAATTVVNTLPRFDYMVQAQYIIRPFDKIEIPFLDDLSKQVTFCALNDERTAPVTPEQLEIFGIQKNRPAAVDLPYTESVKLRWPQSFIQHGYGMVANYKPGPSAVLNDNYEFPGYDSFRNFFTPIPKITGADQDPDDIGKFSLTQTDEPVPLYGSALHKYFAAGWDVFGRWSAWLKKGYLSVAPPPQQPGIMSIRLQLADPDNIYSLAPDQPEVDAVLEIEFGWDWIDRRPSQIQIAGKFFNASLPNPPAGVPAYFGLRAADSSTPVIQVNFASTNPATAPTCSLGTISIMQPNAPAAPVDNHFGSSDVPSNNLVKYKLIVPGVKCSFPGSTPFQVAYAAYIRGMERVRVPISEFSAWSEGYISRLADPRPPAVTVLPATVLFTAVPDVTKIGRGKLSWPAATGALAYYLWEASETAVRVALDPILRTEFPADQTRWLKPMSDPLVDRATQLRYLLAQPKYMNPCQRYFNKITKEPVLQTSYELALPGSSEAMYLYQVSSVNSANIESSKSNVVFYAVPRVVKPAAPMLQVRPYKKKSVSDPVGEGFEVKVVQTIGEAPLGYHLYRTRKKVVGNDIGMKGLAVYEHGDPQWTDTSIQLLDGTTYNGKKVRELGISRSWRPFVYQAIAIGKNDPTRGKFSGESDASTTEIVYFPPDMAPVLISVGFTSNAFSSMFVLNTTAPFSATDLGKTIIDLFTLDANNKRTLLASFIADEVPGAATTLPLASNASQANSLPKINHQPTNIASGITQFSVCVKGSPVKLVVKITDPLNRATEIKVES